MANNIDNMITVSSEKQLKDAINKKYGKIYLDGLLAERISDKVESAHKKSKFGIAGAVGGLVLGAMFTPLAPIGAVALLAGTSTALLNADLKKYNLYKDELGKYYLLRK